MKIICVRCGKVVQVGPEKTVARGLCDECLAHVIEPEFMHERKTAKDGEP
jgi:NMD protein affecting ribosome stability and mRNA decay